MGGWIVLIMKLVANKCGKGGRERRQREIIRMDDCGHSSYKCTKLRSSLGRDDDTEKGWRVGRRFDLKIHHIWKIVSCAL